MLILFGNVTLTFNNHC